MSRRSIVSRSFLSFTSIRLPSMRLPALAACCLTVLSGLALAQEPTLPATAQAPAAAATATPLPSPAERERSATLKQLGVDYEMTLRGIQGSAGIAFSTRTTSSVRVLDRKSVV